MARLPFRAREGSLTILLACLAMVVLLALVSRGPWASPVALKGKSTPATATPEQEEVGGEELGGPLEEPEDAPAEVSGDGAAPEEEPTAAGDEGGAQEEAPADDDAAEAPADAETAGEEEATAAEEADLGEEEEAKEPPKSFSAALAENPKREHVWQT
ncbi:hypothetical protein T484DRAFT_1784473, partial [Baffinella frigidus]